jgi:hypothetical protein
MKYPALLDITDATFLFLSREFSVCINPDKEGAWEVGETNKYLDATWAFCKPSKYEFPEGFPKIVKSKSNNAVFYGLDTHIGVCLLSGGKTQRGEYLDALFHIDETSWWEILEEPEQHMEIEPPKSYPAKSYLDGLTHFAKSLALIEPTLKAIYFPQETKPVEKSNYKNIFTMADAHSNQLGHKFGA